MYINRGGHVDGASGGSDCRSSGDGDGSGGEENCEGEREPGLVDMDMDKELSRRLQFSTFRHSAWRVKGIIPSTLHPTMLRSLVHAMSHDILKHFIKCSYPRDLGLVL